MFRSIVIIPITVAFALCIYGCNTENLWRDRQVPEGAVTSTDPTEGLALEDINVADASEVDLVERVLADRADYFHSLQALRDYYVNHGSHDKRLWADAELDDLRHVRRFKYILSAEVPPPSLKPTDSVVDADTMFQRGLELMKEGGHGVPGLYRQDKMTEALNVFKELISKYPNSDKIDDAAFYCGEIHKEYFKNQELIAVEWYERAKQWNPNLPYPALFQEAVVYDFRLHNRAKALELYQRVLEEETDNSSNTAFATRRIYELTEGADQLQPRPRRSKEGVARKAEPSKAYGSEAPSSPQSAWEPEAPQSNGPNQ